jgi:Uma2 family endonuclease
MSTAKPPPLLWIEYEEAAEAYQRSLPPEHYMEATAQGKQREITLESLALVHAQRSEVQVFNELLVQYPLGRGGKIGQVVPDNMVVVWPEPIQARGSYNLPLQPCGPTWVLEYVSRYNKRKDYEDNFRKYERNLKVPYYLLFLPDAQDLKLYRHTGKKYASVRANEQNRLKLPKLELEVGLLEGWVRFWFRGQLLPLPADLVRQLEESRRQLEESRRQLGETHRQLDAERRARLGLEDELAQLRAQLAQRRSGQRQDP